MAWKSSDMFAEEAYMFLIIKGPELFFEAYLAEAFQSAMAQVHERLLYHLDKKLHEWPEFPPPCERAIVRLFDIKTGEVKL